MSNEIKIRSLTVKDRKKLSTLIQKLSETAGDHSLLNMISSQIKKAQEPATESSGQEDYIQIGLKVLRNLLEILEEETHEWFADLIGVDIKADEEAFVRMPFDTEALIIEQIVDAAEVGSFFTKALQLFNRIKQYQNKQGSQNPKSDSISN